MMRPSKRYGSADLPTSRFDTRYPPSQGSYRRFMLGPLNTALHTVAVTRIRAHPPTQDYA